MQEEIRPNIRGIVEEQNLGKDTVGALVRVLECAVDVCTLQGEDGMKAYIYQQLGILGLPPSSHDVIYGVISLEAQRRSKAAMIEVFASIEAMQGDKRYQLQDLVDPNASPIPDRIKALGTKASTLLKASPIPDSLKALGTRASELLLPKNIQELIAKEKMNHEEANSIIDYASKSMTNAHAVASVLESILPRFPEDNIRSRLLDVLVDKLPYKLIIRPGVCILMASNPDNASRIMNLYSGNEIEFQNMSGEEIKALIKNEDVASSTEFRFLIRLLINGWTLDPKRIISTLQDSYNEEIYHSELFDLCTEAMSKGRISEELAVTLYSKIHERDHVKGYEASINAFDAEYRKRGYSQPKSQD